MKLRNLSSLVLSTFLTTWILVMPSPASAQSKASCTFHTVSMTFPNKGVASPQSMNSYGTMVGFVDEYTFYEGFIRYSNGSVSTYMAPNSSSTYIMDRSNSGVNVGFFTPKGSSVTKGFAAAGSKFQSFVYPGAATTSLNGINKAGTIVGDAIAAGASGFVGFKIQSGQLVKIKPSGAISTFVNAINSNGVIVGNYINSSSSDSHGFVLQSGVYKRIDFPNEVGYGGTTLTGISDTGVIVGWVWTGSDTKAQFLYQNGTFKVISYPNASATFVNGISPNNIIVGVALPSNGSGQVYFTASCH